MTAERLRIRRFTEEDIPFAMELKNSAGWNQVEEDWKSYLAFEPKGCFIAEFDGEKAGTATSILYGRRFGWVGMVLVHPSKRRLGIGTELLKKSIEYLQQTGADCVKLDATPMGKKVYIPLGFADEYEVTRYEGTASIPEDIRILPHTVEISPIRETDMGAVIAFDEACFGASRGNALRRLRLRNGGCSFIAKKGRDIFGYIMERPGIEAIQIGPWAALDSVSAEQLFKSVLQKVSGRRVFLDVLSPNESAIEIMKRYQFRLQRGFTRMYLGQNHHPGCPEQIYGTSGAEKG
jgi:GNAT superfamily N-acetyltransferase